MTLEMDRLDRAVLDIVKSGHGEFDWHEIATRLSALDVPRRPDLFVVLKHLQKRGLLVRMARDQGSDHWAITARGVNALNEKQSESSVGEIDETASLRQALAAGPSAVIDAIRPFIDDPKRFEAALRRILIDDRATAEGVATASLYLPESERGAMARTLSEDSGPEVRRALFRAWAPTRMEVQGESRQSLPDEAWERLLLCGLRDSDPEVRSLATALVFGTSRGERFVHELLANLETHRETDESHLRWRTFLALGSAQDAESLEVLRRIFAGDDLSEASGAIRALAARADGRNLWWAGLEDARDEVRRAALFALARVVNGLDEEKLQALEAPSQPDDLRAAVREYRARLEKNDE